MAAGLGFKTFATGDVLSAADTNGYLMQGVLVFASAAARDSSITSPQEGQFAYLKDTNVTTYYTGSAWANLDTTGMTNPMTTTGDTIYSSSGSTPARLGIGSTGQVLTVAAGVPSWAAPSSGALTLIKTASFTAAADTGTTFDGVFTSTYSTYMVAINWTQSAVVEFYYRVRSGTTTYSSNYESDRMLYTTSATYSQGTGEVLLGVGNSSIKSFANMQISPALAASQRTLGNWQGFAIGSGAALVGSFQQYSAVNHDGFILTAASGTITGTASVYGMAK